MKFLWTFEGGDRKPRKRNFDIKIAEGDVLSLTYFSIDNGLRKIRGQSLHYIFDFLGPIRDLDPQPLQ